MKKICWLKDMALFSVAFLLALNCFAWNGSGTYEDPWQIASDEDIASLAAGTQTNSYSGKYFIQTADISFVENYTWEAHVIGQLALGSEFYPFSGSYDGDGYEVQGLNINATISQATTNAFGLFGYCENATIENVTVHGSVRVNATYNSGACAGAGGVVGLSVGGLYAGLQNNVDVELNLASSVAGVSSNGNIKYGAGGVIGLLAWTPNAGTTFTGCENYGNIFLGADANGAACAGGCFTANVASTAGITTFDKFDNYGSVAVVGKASEGYMPGGALAAGIGVFHHSQGSNNRNPVMQSCSNFGKVVATNAVHLAGIVVNGAAYGGSAVKAYDCTNRAEIVSVSATSGRLDVGGIAASLCDYIDPVVIRCVNYGTLKGLGDGVGVTQLGGIVSGIFGSLATSGFSLGNKNYGRIEAERPNATSTVVGGVSSSECAPSLRDSQNFGDINIQTKGSVLVGGVSSMSSAGKKTARIRNCVNFGNISATGNESTNYFPGVGGVFASTSLTGTNTRDVYVTNCYNLGRFSLNLNSDTCYGGLYSIAKTQGNYAVVVKNCYTLISEGGSLIADVNAEGGAVSVENCVGIVLGKEGKVAASVTGSNNWSQAGTTIVSYADGYKTPSLCDGNITSGFFTQADKTAAPYDLILPINLALFPTQTDDVKALHNFTKALGFKRYKRINK